MVREYRILERYDPWKDRHYYWLEVKTVHKRWLRKPMIKWQTVGLRGLYGELLNAVKTDSWQQVMNWRMKFNANIYSENLLTGDVNLIYGWTESAHGLFICREGLPKPMINKAIIKCT